VSNLFLAYQNRIDEAVLSGGVYAAGFPRDNLKDRRIGKTARSAAIGLAYTQVLASLLMPRTVAAVAVINTNCTRDARYRVRVYSDYALTNVVYDSGWLDVFALWTWAFGSMEWEDARFWDGKPTAEDLTGWFPRDVIHLLDYRRIGVCVKVEFDDQANPDGYLSMGRVFIGNGWTPKYNMSWGAALAPTDLSQVIESPTGTEFFTERSVRRSVKFELKWLTGAEAQRLMDMQRIVKTVGEVLFVFDPANVSYAHRLAFLGHLRQLDALSWPMPTVNSMPFEIKEIK
jgi:hypothetical protein